MTLLSLWVFLTRSIAQLNGRISDEDFEKFASEVNEPLAELFSLDLEHASSSCCFATIAIATCGLGLILGGMCWFLYKGSQYKVRRDNALNQSFVSRVRLTSRAMIQKNKKAIMERVSVILAAYNNEMWTGRGVKMSLGRVKIGVAGRRGHRHAVYKDVVRFTCEQCERFSLFLTAVFCFSQFQ